MEIGHTIDFTVLPGAQRFTVSPAPATELRSYDPLRDGMYCPHCGQGRAANGACYRCHPVRP